MELGCCMSAGRILNLLTRAGLGQQAPVVSFPLKLEFSKGFRNDFLEHLPVAVFVEIVDPCGKQLVILVVVFDLGIPGIRRVAAGLGKREPALLETVVGSLGEGPPLGVELDVARCLPELEAKAHEVEKGFLMTMPTQHGKGFINAKRIHRGITPGIIYDWVQLFDGNTDACLWVFLRVTMCRNKPDLVEFVGKVAVTDALGDLVHVPTQVGRLVDASFARHQPLEVDLVQLCKVAQVFFGDASNEYVWGC